jgi:putative glycosyltransferase (TIGR04372 family)
MIKPLIRAIARIGVLLALYLLVLPLLWLIEPIWRLRFTHLWCARFGPLAFNTHLWLGKLATEGAEKRTTRIFFGARPVNRQLFEMWKRVLPVMESNILSALYHYAGAAARNSRFFKPPPQEFANHRALHHQPVLSFNADDEAKGKVLLDDIGIAPGQWWVCFQAREAAYHLQRGFGDSGSHRDCSIENYLKAAAEITRRGGWALRMGATADRPLPETGDPRIIDYARRHRSDFGDIYLLGKCRFLLCAGTGTESIPPLFGLPVAKANMMPLRPTPVGRNGLYIPKMIRDMTSGATLNYGRCAELGGYDYDNLDNTRLWEYPGNLEKIGLTAVENSDDDVLDLCLDMFDRLDGVAPPAGGAALQALYKRRFFGHVRDVDFMPDIGARFAIKYRHLIEA